MAFFSVVITVYNKAELITNTLKSVLNQTYKAFEVIIVNDGSTDKSASVINTFNDKRITLITTENLGASNARNTGIKAASTDYIALMDGDDTWESSYLQYMHDAISKFPEIKIFTAALAQKYDDKIVPVKYNFRQNELHEVHQYFEASKAFSLIHSSSVVFKKSIIETTGLFDTTIISGQDTDMWIRFGLHYDIVFINKLLAFYNYFPSSLSNTTFDPSKKPKFDKYQKEEKGRHDLKVFLDRNRYSLALLSKLQNDRTHFNYYKNRLDTNNLSFKKNLLLRSPKWLLSIFVKLVALKGEKIYYSEH